MGGDQGSAARLRAVVVQTVAFAGGDLDPSNSASKREEPRRATGLFVFLRVHGETGTGLGPRILASGIRPIIAAEGLEQLLVRRL